MCKYCLYLAVVPNLGMRELKSKSRHAVSNEETHPLLPLFPVPWLNPQSSNNPGHSRPSPLSASSTGAVCKSDTRH